MNSRASSKQRPQKRSYPETDSEDSFDAPVEFITVTENKKLKPCNSSTPSPLKQLNCAQSPLKRSPKLTLEQSKNAFIGTNLVSDWDESLKNNIINKTVVQENIENIEIVPTPLCTQSSIETEQLPERILSDIKNPEKIENGIYYVDSLMHQKMSSKENEGSDTNISNNQMVLIVQEVRRTDDETHHLVCRNSARNTAIVYLQDIWEEIKVDPGNTIRLIDPEPWGENDYIISLAKGLIIVEPDILLSSTTIAAATWCPRKAILGLRFKEMSGANKAMLIGCIIHELFQIAIKNPSPKSVSVEWLFAQWKKNTSSEVWQSFVALKFSPQAFETELEPYAKVIVAWVHTHMPNDGSLALNNLPTNNSIVYVHDIEENVWEPRLGIKGKIDATLNVRNSHNKMSMEALELKTGKSGVSSEHSCQILLYSMMLAIRYNQAMFPGTLLYLKDGTSRAVIPRRPEILGILQQRNNLAYYLSQNDHSVLPEPKSDPRFCDRCAHNVTCSLYSEQNLYREKVSSSFSDFAKQTLNHLDNSDREYFSRWCNGLFNEYQVEHSKDRLSNLWKLFPEDRERMGSAFANVILVSVEHEVGDTVKLGFRRDKSFENNSIQQGSQCTISQEDRFGIVICYVLDVKSNYITVRCDYAISNINVGSLYQLDFYSSFSSFANNMGSLLLLLENSPIGDRLRSLIVNLNRPIFVSPETYSLPGGVQSILFSSNLNKQQRAAVEHSLNARDYALIEGLPGAGKTTTIAVLIRCLIVCGQSVLLTSYTNSAVDTVISKLLQDVPTKQILRLGRIKYDSKVSAVSITEKLKVYDTADEKCTSSYELTRKILKETPIVACTCYHASREVLLSWRKFDVCIVDEASMVLEPVVIPALTASTKFIMVGDTKQLAPLTLHKDSRKYGLNVSLFERLQVHNNAISSLTEQFRMNKKIASLSSKLFYNERLVCANDEIGEATIKRICNPPLACNPVFSSVIEDSCIWVDVPCDLATVNAESINHTSNTKEVKVVEDIIQNFLKLGVEPNHMGVMCTYNAQVEQIRRVTNVEVNTIDQYQGKDKHIIIWSTVWTSHSKKKCDLLHDERRVNVALTRAKQKMVIVGCCKSMQGIDVMTKLLLLMKKTEYHI